MIWGFSYFGLALAIVLTGGPSFLLGRFFYSQYKKHKENAKSRALQLEYSTRVDQYGDQVKKWLLDESPRAPETNFEVLDGKKVTETEMSGWEVVGDWLVRKQKVYKEKWVLSGPVYDRIDPQVDSDQPQFFLSKVGRGFSSVDSASIKRATFYESESTARDAINRSKKWRGRVKPKKVFVGTALLSEG